MPARSHNGGPQLLSAAAEQRIEQLRAEIARLIELAKIDGSSAVARATACAPWHYFPSRITLTDRAYLAGIRAAAEAKGYARRLPQIARLQRKIARLGGPV